MLHSKMLPNGAHPGSEFAGTRTSVRTSLPASVSGCLRSFQHISRCSSGTSTRRQRSDVAVQVGRRTLLGGLAPCACINCKRNGWYDSYFAFNMAHGMQEYEAAIAPVKQQLFQQGLQPLLSAAPAGSSSSAPLNILEVGMGTGPNFGYYQAIQQQQQQPPSVFKITGLEPNPAMWPYAQQSAASTGFLQQLELVSGSAEQLPLQDESFDAAVITLVLCSLPHPAQALSEVQRVLKPGGRLMLIEHVISPQLNWLQVQQRLLDPLQQLLADNCHLTRDTAAVVQSQPGFKVLPLQVPAAPAATITTRDKLREGSSSRGGSSDEGGLLHFEVEGMGLIAPHVAGLLRKQPTAGQEQVLTMAA